MPSAGSTGMPPTESGTRNGRSRVGSRRRSTMSARFTAAKPSSAANDDTPASAAIPPSGSAATASPATASVATHGV